MFSIGNFSADFVLRLARLCDDAYLLDDKAVVTALGMTWLGQVGNAECQATVAAWDKYAVVAFRGTQVARNFSIPELFDDIDNDVIHLAEGRVHCGFWSPLAALWPSIAALMPSGEPLITGHSLGGVRAHLAKAFLPAAQVISFGAPRGADDAFWTAHYADSYPPLRVVHERDFAPGWPWDGPWTHPADAAWLHDGKFEMVKKRAGWCISVGDHSIDQGYVPALAVIAGK